MMDDLAKALRALADAGHERATELREAADSLDAATQGHFAEPPTHTALQLLAAQHRARTLHREIFTLAINRA